MTDKYTVTVKPEKKDFTILSNRTLFKRSPFTWISYLFCIFHLIFFITSFDNFLDVDGIWFAILHGGIAGGLTAVINNKLIEKFYDLCIEEKAIFLEKHSFIINEKNIETNCKSSNNLHLWKDIFEVSKYKKYIFIYIDKLRAFVIPMRCFDTPEDAEDFYNKAMEFWYKAKAND